MNWVDYIIFAAQHSKGSASHWFRYLRKDIDKCGVLFSEQDVANLCKNEALTMFQRITLKAAFTEGTLTREHIIGLNQRAKLSMIQKVREKYEKADKG